MLQANKRELHSRAAGFYVGRDHVLHAQHLDRAASPEAPQAYLAAAAEESDQYRYEVGLRLVARALEIAPTEKSLALRSLQGALQRNMGAVPESIDTYRQALTVAELASERCHARLGIAEGLRLLEQHGELLEVLDQAESDAASHELLLEQARIHQLRGSVHFTRGEIEKCLLANERSLDRARAGQSSQMEAQALGGLGDAEFARGHMISFHAYCEQGIERSRSEGLARVLAANLPMRGQTYRYRNLFDEALDLADAAIHKSTQTGCENGGDNNEGGI